MLSAALAMIAGQSATVATRKAASGGGASLCKEEVFSCVNRELGYVVEGPERVREGPPGPGRVRNGPKRVWPGLQRQIKT